MLVFYSGWGYWEQVLETDSNGQPFIVSDDPEKACGVFELPKNAAKEVKYKGETICNYLFFSELDHEDLEAPMRDFNTKERAKFILCEEWTENNNHLIENPAIEKPFKFTRNDVVPVPDGDMPNKTTVIEQNKITMPAYLDPNHPMFSEELKIAIDAWNAVLKSNPDKPKTGSRKKLIENWLKHNYPDVKQLSNLAKERISILINPDKSGGAPSSD